MDRKKVINSLLQNAEGASRDNEPEILKWSGIVTASIDGKELYIPGYIPYIGEKYFSNQTEGCRILIYALNQNLLSKNQTAINWAKSWVNSDKTNALDRQNVNYRKDRFIMMGPFDTGHLPVLAAILCSILGKRAAEIDTIFDVIAATNLSKYSFRTSKGNTTDYVESLEKCFEWYSYKELSELTPDYIICAGDKVYNIVRKKIRNIIEGCIVIKVAFPSLQVINRHYRKKLGLRHKSANQILLTFPNEDHKKPSSYTNKMPLEDIVKRDEYYFSSMHESIKNQINT